MLWELSDNVKRDKNMSNAEMKANRDAEVQKHFDRIINFKKPEMPKK